MKKIPGLLALCLLSACIPPENHKKYTVPAADQPFFTQPMDTAPLPWLHIVPSERTVALDDVHFLFIQRLIRKGMIPFPDKFAKVSLVLVDYAILPAEFPTLPKKKHSGVNFCEKYLPKPEKYFLEIRFYTNNKKPPAPPLYMGSVVVSPRTAHPHETIRYMVDSLVFELGSTSSHRISLNLSAQTGFGNTRKPQPSKHTHAKKKAPPPGQPI